jgi:hypothetical protein
MNKSKRCYSFGISDEWNDQVTGAVLKENIFESEGVIGAFTMEKA